MATDPNALILGLLQGAGLGRTVGDFQQQQAQIQGQQVNNRLGALQIDQVQAAQAANDQYAHDEAVYAAKPTLDGLVALAAKHPDKAETLQKLWAMKDDEQKQGDLAAIAPAYAALDNNKPDLAVSALQARADAERKAGIDASELDDAITRLKSGDPEQVSAVKAALMAHMALSGKGPLAEAFAKKLVAVPAGDEWSNTPQGDLYNKQTGERRPYAGGGGQASTGAPSGPTVGGVPVTASTPFEQVKQHIINHEAPDAVGGYNAIAYNVPGGKNAAGLAPVNLTGMTIGQVLQYQTGTMRPKTKGQRGADDVGSTGVGAYQLESGTLAQNAAKTFGKDWRDQPFTPENQDRIAETLWNNVRGDPVKLGNTWAAFKGQTAPKPAQMAHADPTTEFYAQKLASGMDPSNLSRLFPGKENAGQRADIARRAAQIQIGQGVTAGDSNLVSADVKSAGAALTALQRTRNSLDPYLATFDGNVAQVRQLAPQGVGGSIPLFNRWIQAGRTSGKGDPALARFNVAINAVANENAKIMSGASGGAISSDSARHEAMSLINNAQTLPGLMAALDQMQTDTKIRLKGLDDRQEALRARISGRSPSPPPSAPHQPVQIASAIPSGAKPIGTYKGAPVYLLPNGKKWTP